MTSTPYDVAASFPTTTARVHMGKAECSWCEAPALWEITDRSDPWTDLCCTSHRNQWFPEAKTPTVSLAKAGVPAHGIRPTWADLRNRLASR